MLLGAERRVVELKEAASVVELGKKYRMLICPMSRSSRAENAADDRIEVVVWETSPTMAVTLNRE